MAGLEDFCCICVKKYQHLESLNDTDENNIKHHQKLSAFVPDQKWYQEYNICRNCLEMLDSAYQFLQKCLLGEELRREQLRILTEQNESKDKIVTKVEVFECDLCKKEFKLKRSLKLHVTRIHNDNNYKFNKTDQENVEPQIILENGIKTEEGIKSEDKSENQMHYTDDSEKLEMPEIMNDFSDEDKYDNEPYSGEDDMQILIPESKKKKYNKRKNPLTCEYCGKIFHRRQHYSAHIRAKHTFEKPYECNLCDARYTNSHSLLVHKRNHNNEKPFICSYCGKSFVCSGDLYHHSKIHLNKREYKCTQCDKSFNTASILRTHKICMHTDPKEWKYVCNYCSRKFPINSSLVTHVKRHTGIKEFGCHICDKKFFDKSELTKHLRCHSNERTFKCKMCPDKRYKNSYGLRKHMKLIHDVGTLKICKPEKKFLCPACPKIFAFNNKLQKHMCTHTGEKPFKCHVCDKKFIDNYYRKVHLKKKHNIDLAEEFH